MLQLEHPNLHRMTALGFAPGTHSFFERLDAHLPDKKEESTFRIYSGAGPVGLSTQVKPIAGSES